MVKVSILIIIVIGIFIESCSIAIPEPTQPEADWASRRWTGTTVDTLSHGRRLYIGHCSGCHSLHRPERYDESKWKEALDEMQKKARLTDAEKGLVLRYLVTMEASVKSVK